MRVVTGWWRAEKAPCQNAEEEEEEDDDDHDHILIDAVSELLGVMAKTWGPAFEPHFQTVFPLLQKYLKPSRQVRSFSHSPRSLPPPCMS